MNYCHWGVAISEVTILKGKSYTLSVRENIFCMNYCSGIKKQDFHIKTRSEMNDDGKTGSSNSKRIY